MSVNFKEMMGLMTEEQKRELMRELEDDVQKSEVKISKPRVREDFTVSRNINNSKGKVAVRAGKNKWTDVGEHGDIVSETGERAPRTRKSPKKEKVNCSVCGKSFSIQKSLIFGDSQQRCNTCTGQ